MTLLKDTTSRGTAGLGKGAASLVWRAKELSLGDIVKLPGRLDKLEVPLAGRKASEHLGESRG